MHRRHKLISHGTALKIGLRGTVKDPRVNIACKCEKFTEAEITEAIQPHRGCFCILDQGRSLVACDFPPHPPAYINLLANRSLNAGSVTLLVQWYLTEAAELQRETV